MITPLASVSKAYSITITGRTFAHQQYLPADRLSPYSGDVRNHASAIGTAHIFPAPLDQNVIAAGKGLRYRIQNLCLRRLCCFQYRDVVVTQSSFVHCRQGSSCRPDGCSVRTCRHSIRAVNRLIQQTAKISPGPGISARAFHMSVTNSRTSFLPSFPLAVLSSANPILQIICIPTIKSLLFAAFFAAKAMLRVDQLLRFTALHLPYGIV